MVLAAGAARALGADTGARLRFGEEPKAEGTWAGRRLLLLDEKPAFELSFWCGTRQFLFKRLEGENGTLSVAEFEERLAAGLDDLDEDVIGCFAQLLPAGTYVPLLLSIEPRFVRPGEPGDYFAEEQVDTWGINGFWGLPEYPQTGYYRAYEAPVSLGAHLYEFVVPMVPPGWNELDRVATHRDRLEASPRPTAVAVSTLDVCQPAMSDGSRDYYAHWALTHFLLDGHHKLDAAAQTDRPMRLLSLDASLGGEEKVPKRPGPTLGSCRTTPLR